MSKIFITIGNMQVPCTFKTVPTSKLLDDDRYQRRYDVDLEKRGLDIAQSVTETGSKKFRDPIVVRRTSGGRYLILDGFGRRESIVRHLKWEQVNVAIVSGDEKKYALIAAGANVNQVCQRHLGKKDKKLACWELRQLGIDWKQIADTLGLAVSTAKGYSTEGGKLARNKANRKKSLVSTDELFINAKAAEKLCLRLFNEMLEPATEIKRWQQMQLYVLEHFGTKVSLMRADDNEIHKLAFDFKLNKEQHGRHRALVILYRKSLRAVNVTTRACEHLSRWFKENFTAVNFTPNLNRFGAGRDTILQFLEAGRQEAFQSVETA